MNSVTTNAKHIRAIIAVCAASLLPLCQPPAHAQTEPLDDTTLSDFEFTDSGSTQLQQMRDTRLIELVPVLRGPSTVDGIQYKHQGWPVATRFPWALEGNATNERTVVLIRNLFNHSPGDYKTKPNNTRRVIYADGNMSTWLPENVKTAEPALGVNPIVDHDNNATTPAIRFPGNYDYLGMHAVNWIYPNSDTTLKPRLITVTAKYDIDKEEDATAATPVSTMARFNYRVYTSDDGGVRWTEQDQVLSKINIPLHNPLHVGPNLLRHPEWGLLVPFGKSTSGVADNNILARTPDGIFWERTLWKNNATEPNRGVETTMVTWGNGHILAIARERTDTYGFLAASATSGYLTGTTSTGATYARVVTGTQVTSGTTFAMLDGGDLLPLITTVIGTGSTASSVETYTSVTTISGTTDTHAYRRRVYVTDPRYAYIQNVYKHEKGASFSTIQNKFVTKKTNIVGNGYDPFVLKNAQPWEAHDTPEAIYNPETGRLEVIQSHRWGGGPGKVRPTNSEGVEIPLSEDPSQAMNSLNIWSIDPVDLLNGSADWRFDGTLIERQGIILGGGSVAAAGVIKAHQDGFHPGGSIVDEKNGRHHMFIYVGKYNDHANTYRLSRTLDTYAIRTKAGLTNTEEKPAITSVSYTGKDLALGVYPGDLITIDGARYGTLKEVLIGGVSVEIDRINSTAAQLLVYAPAGTTDGTVTVRTEWGQVKSPNQVLFNTAPVFPNAGAQQAVVSGKSVVLYANATARPAATYRWQIRTSIGGAWTDIADGPDYAGTLTDALTILTPDGKDGWQYRCVAQNELGQQSGEAIMLKVVPDYMPAPTGVVATSGSIAYNIYVSDAALHTIQKIAPNGAITTLAGQSGVPGSANGTGTAAQFNTPKHLSINHAGVLIVADSGNNALRAVTADGVVTTTGTGADATLAAPAGVASRHAASGETYIADTQNHLIKKISATGTVSIVAGSGVPGDTNGPALLAKFSNPSGVAVDIAGNLYVADTDNHTIRFIDTDTDFSDEGANGNIVSLLAGAPASPGATNGDALTQATFNAPKGVVLDSGGVVYIADSGNSLIRAYFSGTVTTIAGSAPGFADGHGSVAQFNNPTAIALAEDGSLYVADTGNHAIRRIADDGHNTVSTLYVYGTSNPAPNPQPVPDDGQSPNKGAGGGAPSPWFFIALPGLLLIRALRKK